MKTKTLGARINKYPYFLWLTYFKKLDFDFENMKVKSDVGESDLKKVSKYWIFILKYLPFLFLLTFGSYPTDLHDATIFFCCFVFVFLSINILLSYTRHFLKYLFLISSLIVFLIYNDSSIALVIDTATVYVVELIIIISIARDIFKKNYEKYYYLESVKKMNTVHLAKKHTRPIFPMTPKIESFGWKGKGFFRAKRGFNLNFSYKLGGYFIRVEYEN